MPQGTAFYARLTGNSGDGSWVAQAAVRLPSSMTLENDDNIEKLSVLGIKPTLQLGQPARHWGPFWDGIVLSAYGIRRRDHEDIEQYPEELCGVTNQIRLYELACHGAHWASAGVVHTVEPGAEGLRDHWYYGSDGERESIPDPFKLPQYLRDREDILDWRIFYDRSAASRFAHREQARQKEALRTPPTHLYDSDVSFCYNW